ncbi:hypothetical protein CRYUN_Cryun18bG0084400 [Craigia yunnanensis]
MKPLRKDSSTTAKDALNDAVSDKQRRRRDEEDDWDWDRWKKHFEQVDEQERLLSVLKLQLNEAVRRQDYEDAARLKVAIAAVSTNDLVGSHIPFKLVEERFQDAAFLRDNAGAELVGWWAGLSDDTKDPYGLIIRITVPSMADMSLGVLVLGSLLLNQLLCPCLRSFLLSHQPLGSIGIHEEKSDLFVVSTEHDEDGDDADDGSDVGEGLTGFQNILRDMIPDIKVKVLKVTAPGKVDRDFISKGESDQERDQIEMDADSGVIESDRRSEIAVKVVGGLVQKLSGRMPATESHRIPAKLMKKGHLTFSFSIEKDINQQDSGLKTRDSMDRKAKDYILVHMGFILQKSFILDANLVSGKGIVGLKESSDLEFYEYVEAVKLTGDPYVPAG